MTKLKHNFTILISVFTFIIPGFNSLYSKTCNDFISDFRKSLDYNYTQVQLNKMFRDYSPLLTPHSDTINLYNQLKGIKNIPYPLEEFKKHDLYKNNIKKLLLSSNPNHRVLSYLIIAASNEKKFNSLLLQRIKNEENKGNRIWAGMALLHLKDKHTSELFDFIVNNENFGNAHMLPLYLKLDKNLLRGTAYIRIKDENVIAKILAVSILGVTGLNKKTDKVLKEAVVNWPVDIKGYAICSLKILNAGYLLDTLKPYLNNRKTKNISLQALANSPTLSDQDFVLNLIPSSKTVPKDILNLLLNSSNKRLAGEWLKLVQSDYIPSDYSPNIEPDSCLLSKKMRILLLDAVQKIKSPEVLSEIANNLRGEKFYNTENVLIILLKHENSLVRYWAANSLKGSRSKTLIEILPELLKNPSYRTVALTKLIIENNIKNLQQVYEEILLKDGEDRDWRRDCIEYLTIYPLERHKALFKKYLSNEKEDWSIHRDSALGLGRLKDKNSVDLIIKVMEEKRKYRNSDYNKITYLKALAMIKGERAKTAIKKYKNSEENQVRKLVNEIFATWDQ